MLPELPRKLRKREADHTRAVLEWFKENYLGGCVVIEIKYSSGNSVPRRAVLPHQIAALTAANSGRGLVHKLSDEARRQQPFDAFLMRSCDAFVVCVFGGSRGVGVCHAVPVRMWGGIKREMNPDSLRVIGGFSFRI